MALLQTLNLKPPKGFVPAGRLAHGAPTPTASSASAAPPAAVATNGHGGNAAAGAHAEAAKLKGAIERRHRQAYDAWTRLDEAAPKLKKLIAATKGEQKTQLEAKQKLLAKKAAEAKKALDQAGADLEAIDNPGTHREELIAILARNKSNAHLASEIEVDATGLDPYKRKVEKDVTTTTTSYANGRSSVDKVRDQRKVGADGVTQTHSRETEMRSGGSAVRSSSEKKTNVSFAGKVTREEKKSIEVEAADGSTSKREVGTSTEVSAHGASQTKTTTKTNFDGSSTSASRTGGVERGEGKLGATAGASSTRTDSSGRAVTTSGKGSGGMLAGKDGIGGFGSAEGGLKSTNSKGIQKGAVVGLDAKVTCNIGEPQGRPPLYPLTLRVDLGASITLSAGRSKEGSSNSFSVEAKGGATVYMTETHMLSEAEAADYVRALQAASKGGTVAATHKEFAIVAAGVKHGWAVAQQMWKSGGKPLSKEMIAALKNVGDSTEIGGSETVGVGAKVGVKGIGVEGSETDSRDHSTKATRNDKGTVDVATRSGHTQQRAGKISFAPGPVGVEVGVTRTVRTTLGFSIVIDPKNDPDGKLFAALGKCTSDTDYEAFVARYKSRITVVERTDGKAQSDSTTIGVSVGDHKAEIGTHQGIAVERTVDGKGAFKRSKVVGTAGAGGKIGSIGDSRDDEATAERDADGNASLDLAQTHNDTDYGKAARNMVRKVPGGSRLVGNAKKEASGALTKAAGGDEDDSATKDVAGIRLNQKDLKRIGQIVCTNRSRWDHAVRRYQELVDWKQAGNAIVRAKGDPGVVAEELARFIGGDRIMRLQTVELFLRGGNDISMGTGYEFPDSLKSKRADYERLIEAPFEPALDQIAATDAAKAAEQGKQLAAEVDALYTAFYQAQDFEKPALQAEMLATMTRRRTAIANAIRKYAGQTSAADDKKATEATVKRMLEHCFDYDASQKKLFDELADLLDGDEYFLIRRLSDAHDCIRQLDDVHARWRNDYDEAVRLAKSVGMRPGLYDQDILKPNAAQLQRYKKAARM